MTEIHNHILFFSCNGKNAQKQDIKRVQAKIKKTENFFLTPHIVNFNGKNQVF